MKPSALIRRLPWILVLLACGTLGLAPFSPMPHVWEKLLMLASGELIRPLDIFDLLLHGSPWFLLGAKAVLSVVPGPGANEVPPP